MTSITTVTLPYPPTINSYYGRSRSGRVFLKAKGRAYRSTVKSLCRHLPEWGDCPLAVSIIVQPPDLRRRDLDNVLKALLDAMEHANVYDNDHQIARLVVERGDPVKGGSVYVSITAMEAA